MRGMVDYGAVIRAHGFEPETKDDWVEILAETHGDIEDAKASLIFISDEEDFEVEAEDIETVTEEPPNATFT